MDEPEAPRRLHPATPALGRRLLARRWAGGRRTGGRQLARLVADRRRPKLLPAATRLAQARSLARRRSTAVEAAPPLEVPGMSDWAARWIFGEEAVEGVPFESALLAREPSEEPELPSFLVAKREQEETAAVAEAARRAAPIQRGRVEEVPTGFKLARKPLQAPPSESRPAPRLPETVPVTTPAEPRPDTPFAELAQPLAEAPAEMPVTETPVSERTIAREPAAVAEAPVPERSAPESEPLAEAGPPESGSPEADAVQPSGPPPAAEMPVRPKAVLVSREERTAATLARPALRIARAAAAPEARPVGSEPIAAQPVALAGGPVSVARASEEAAPAVESTPAPAGRILSRLAGAVRRIARRESDAAPPPGELAPPPAPADRPQVASAAPAPRRPDAATPASRAPGAAAPAPAPRTSSAAAPVPAPRTPSAAASAGPSTPQVARLPRRASSRARHAPEILSIGAPAVHAAEPASAPAPQGRLARMGARLLRGGPTPGGGESNEVKMGDTAGGQGFSQASSADSGGGTPKAGAAGSAGGGGGLGGLVGGMLKGMGQAGGGGGADTMKAGPLAVGGSLTTGSLTSGDVTVGGSFSAGGEVSAGPITAGSEVTIGGNVSAGPLNVGASVEAGGSLSTKSLTVGGAVAAAGPVAATVITANTVIGNVTAGSLGGGAGAAAGAGAGGGGGVARQIARAPSSRPVVQIGGGRAPEAAQRPTLPYPGSSGLRLARAAGAEIDSGPDGLSSVHFAPGFAEADEAPAPPLSFGAARAYTISRDDLDVPAAPPPAAAAAAAAPPAPGGGGQNVDEIAEKVYELLRRNLTIERERWGR